MNKIHYFFKSFEWLKILFSPFTSFKFKLYVGKTQIGTPYFLPRKWVKLNKEDCLRKATQDCQNPQHIKYGFDPESISHQYANWTKPVPLTIGFDYCSLGWKTKWTSTDFRHEWNPIYTFVFFGYQIAITIYHEHHSHFWESWLCYEYISDKKLSKRERIAFCRKKCPQTWTSHKHNEEPVTTDYWDLILKPKNNQHDNSTTTKD